MNHLVGGLSWKRFGKLFFGWKEIKRHIQMVCYLKFFRIARILLKNDLLGLFDDLSLGHLDLSGMNFRIITLIPKKKGVDKIEQFCSICLLNVCFKIFSKALSIHLILCLRK
jgi:hypothetical protein